MGNIQETLNKLSQTIQTDQNTQNIQFPALQNEIKKNNSEIQVVNTNDQLEIRKQLEKKINNMSELEKKKFTDYVKTNISYENHLRGRYVLIKNKMYEYLNLSGIKIFDLNNINISRGKRILSSSIYSEKFKPENLIADNVKNISRTKNGKDEWFLIDLGEMINISHIQIFNRLDCCGDRIVGGKIEILDDNKNIIASSSFDTEKLVYKFDKHNMKIHKIKIHNKECNLWFPSITYISKPDKKIDKKVDKKVDKKIDKKVDQEVDKKVDQKVDQKMDNEIITKKKSGYKHNKILPTILGLVIIIFIVYIFIYLYRKLTYNINDESDDESSND